MNVSRARFAVFGFTSTHDALTAENLLLASGSDVVLIPTPRTLGSLCGFAVRVPAEGRDAALEILSGAGVEPDGQAEIWDRV